MTKLFLLNNQFRFKYTSKPQSEEGSDQDYENEQTSEYDDEESYEDENLSNNVKKENIQYELQEDSGESDYYYNDSKVSFRTPIFQVSLNPINCAGK